MAACSLVAAIKRYPADVEFSRCVRERAGWNCQRCGTNYEHNGQGLDCSHLVGRANKSTRWDGNNAAALCRGCHSYFTAHPLEHVRWFEDNYGRGCVEMVREKSQGIYKGWKKDLKEIAKHYREQHKAMEEQRANGVVGWLEFESYQ